MYLKEQFLRLPLQFDAEALADEINALPGEAWVPHPNNHPGNSAVRLVTPNGEETEGVAGQMTATRWLRACPYMMEVMTAIGATWGRSRLMGLAPGAVVPAHIDTNYYWRKHVRVHVPIITEPGVLFTAGTETVHMAPGECWIFDTYSVHHVRNGGTRKRTHLVIDTVGGGRMWELANQARAARLEGRTAEPLHVRPGDVSSQGILYERAMPEAIMSPWELQCHVAFIAENAAPGLNLDKVLARMEQFVASWHGLWARYGTGEEGLPHYREAVSALEADLLDIEGDKLVMRNRMPLYRQVAELVFAVSVTLGGVERAQCSGAVAA